MKPLPIDLAEVRRLYVETDVPNNVIGERYGKAANWVNGLATKYGWPVRKYSKAGKPQPGLAPVKVKRPHAHKAKSIAQIYSEQKAEQDDRDQELYGGIIEDVAMLRRVGFVVTRLGDDVLVGNRICTFAEVVELAARERRLRAPVQGFFQGAPA